MWKLIILFETTLASSEFTVSFFVLIWYNSKVHECIILIRSDGGNMLTEFSLGDHVVMRKPHACGSNEWQIVRDGADIKIKCIKCGRIVMLDRGDFIRSAKKRITVPLEVDV